ncbi:MAG: ferritin-like fold-containing protein [Actinomycetaceae bacterium]|nr:ferritin-like fold-containing protein [Actinomycetaceae bacterium]
MASNSYKELLGLGAYAAISAQTRLAKDGDQAPMPWEHVDMANMSGRAWEGFKLVVSVAESEGVDIAEAMAPYEGMLDEIDARLRPTTWWERLTKTYVAMGIFTDALRETALAHGANDYAKDVHDFGHGDWVRKRLEPEVAGDKQLEARLSLWTRRVGGEALSLVRAFYFTHPEVLQDADSDAVMERISAAHKERLAAVHLHA